MDNIADYRLQIIITVFGGALSQSTGSSRVPGGEHQFLILNAPYILIGCWLTPTAAGQTVDDDRPWGECDRIVEV